MPAPIDNSPRAIRAAMPSFPSSVSSHVRRPLRAAIALLLLAACGEKLPLVPPSTGPCEPKVTSVVVSPGAVTLPVGVSQSFAGTAVGTACLPNFAVSWRSSDTTVASVTATGTAFSRAPGTASIIAVAQFDTLVRGTATITVR